jgi:asparagine synthase (glutamine-hydrolysing)
MCGICGIADANGDPPDTHLLHAMAQTLVHRGPDDQGVVVRGGVGIAARRLSIIDVEGGHQPIANEDETVWCALNGEIYNHPKLMQELTSKGHCFRTRCDTEVIVHLYEEYGLEFLTKLDGMFALVVWDTRTQTMILARDQMGIKPLYYAAFGSRLVFGSELKAVLPAGVPTDFDLDAIDAYFTLSYIPAPHTIFRAVRKLCPGHYLLWKPGQAAREIPYWLLPANTTDGFGRAHVDELAVELLRLLRVAVKRHMISDVPLGAFLSGGLDSSAVVALMAEQTSEPIRTFSVGFDEHSYDETEHARDVARVFATEHHELIQRPDPTILVNTLASLYDEPFADSSALAVLTVAGLARRHVTVALTGDGGDEVFGGYLTYRADQLAGVYRRLPDLVRHGLVPYAIERLPTSDRKLSFDFKAKRFVRSADLPAPDAHLGWKAIFTEEARQQLLPSLPDHNLAQELMRRYYSAGPEGDPIGRCLHADSLLGLPDDMLTKVDRATMAVSLEARVPLLDRGVVEFMAALPSSYKVHGWELKYLFKRAVKDIVPQTIIQRKKEGFNMPVARWVRQDLRELTLDVLSPSRLSDLGIFNRDVIESMLIEHLDGTVDRGREVWTLLMFALWHEEFCRKDIAMKNVTAESLSP